MIVVDPRARLGHAERVRGLQVVIRVERHEEAVVAPRIVPPADLPRRPVIGREHARADVERLVVVEKRHAGRDPRLVPLVVTLLQEVVPEGRGFPGGVVEPSVQGDRAVSARGADALGSDADAAGVERLSVGRTGQPSRTRQEEEIGPLHANRELVNPTVPQRFGVLDVEAVRPVALSVLLQAPPIDVGDGRRDVLAIVEDLDGEGLVGPRAVPYPAGAPAAVARLVVSLERSPSVRPEHGGSASRSEEWSDLRGSRIDRGPSRDVSVHGLAGVFRRGSEVGRDLGPGREPEHGRHGLGPGQPGVGVPETAHGLQGRARRLGRSEVTDPDAVPAAPPLHVDRQLHLEQLVDAAGLGPRVVDLVEDRDLDAEPGRLLSVQRRGAGRARGPRRAAVPIRRLIGPPARAAVRLRSRPRDDRGSSRARHPPSRSARSRARR